MMFSSLKHVYMPVFGDGAKPFSFKQEQFLFWLFLPKADPRRVA